MLWGVKNKVTKKNTPHRHDMHELVICLGNSGNHWVNGHFRPFKRGMMVFLPSESSHYIDGSIGQGAEFAFVCFDRLHFFQREMSDIHNILEELISGNHYFASPESEYEENIYLGEKLISELSAINPYSTEKAEKYLAILLINFHRCVNAASQLGISANYKEIKKICKKIIQQPQQQISLMDGVKTSALSRTGFVRKFKEITGETFIDFLHKARIKKSMDLLYRTELSITEVSFESGFNHLGHFHRIFKKHCGMTPGKFRIIVRKEGQFPRIITVRE